MLVMTFAQIMQLYHSKSNKCNQFKHYSCSSGNMSQANQRCIMMEAK